MPYVWNIVLQYSPVVLPLHIKRTYYGIRFMTYGSFRHPALNGPEIESIAVVAESDFSVLSEMR